MAEYVKKIEEVCGVGEEKDFIVILKHAKIEELMKIILKKCKIEQKISGFFKVRFKEKEISVFRNGKLIIKGLKEKKEVEKILKMLFS